MKLAISLTARLSLLFAASAACVLLVAGLLFEHAVATQFLEHDREELYGKMKLLKDELAAIRTQNAVAALPLHLRNIGLGHPPVMVGDGDGDEDDLPIHLRDIGLEHPGMTIVVVASGGEVLFSAGPGDVVSNLIREAGNGETEPVIRRYANQIYRVITARLALGIPGTPPENVAVGLDITDDQNFFASFRKFLWGGMLLVVLAMGSIAWLAVRKGLSPLHEVSGMVANISAHRLDKPLPVADVPPELQELVCSFNKMLARLEDSFRRLSEFSSDIAHELRTPIHNLVVQTQVTLGRERSTEDYRSVLQSSLEEYERLARMISDMLFLAQADNRLVATRTEPVELHSEVERLREFYEALASERGVRLLQSGTATVIADRLMIQRALSNLISNAIRFTPEGMAIEIAISEDAEWTTVAVVNPGPTIPAEHLPNVFDRFYRVDASRREGNVENAGLGLSIAKSIVEMHGGIIRAESENDRTCFSFSLPKRQR
jgi:two-component system heavy metal sensor histidine kinase CusS